ncbi:MAG TPA: PPC domain-containing protein, partial [Aggregatilineales bacterium]|nr:PPC domain-containing protein [Aggregatilineales bacterium]
MQRFLSLLVLLTVLLITGIPVLAQDSLQQGLGLRDVLVDGQVFEDTMQAPDTMHLYAFEGVAGSTVTITMTRTEGNLDPLLILLAKDGVLIAWDDDSGNDLNAQISAELPEQDIYFVLASSLKTLYQTGERENISGGYLIEIIGASNDSPLIERDPTRLAIPRIQLDSAIPAGIDEQRPVFFAWLTVQDSITVDLAAPSNEID